MQNELPMRIVGGKKPRPYWERFDRLQRRANLLLGGLNHPKGVFRFKTWEEFNEWKMNCRIQNARQRKTTS
jgi:hypothetical protein